MTAGNADFYDRTALWWGSSAPTARDRDRALRIHRPGRPLRVLELGAGFGGAAASTADLGHDVVAIERSPRRAALARRHLVRARPGRLDVIEGDFLECAIGGTFDVVVCWSGFGGGDDSTHVEILCRVREWLAPDGVGLVDVFDPVWWEAANGSERSAGGLHRRFGFDATTRRLSIACWSERRPMDVYVENVRCYEPREFLMLAERAGLALAGFDRAALSHDAPSYLAELRRR